MNVDHVATLRQARGGVEPNVLEAVFLAERAGCDSIVVHLREDRRHILEKDVFLLKEHIGTLLNLEMAIDEEVIQIALKVMPHSVCLVPEKRQELTTEGGMDVLMEKELLKKNIAKLKERGIRVVLFVDPNEAVIEASKDCGADGVELHTGDFASCKNDLEKKQARKQLFEAAKLANARGLVVHAGHGLNYFNVKEMLAMPFLEAVNIGHSIVSRAVMVGMERAVLDMLRLLNR